MTDLEELKALLTKWGVPFREGSDALYNHPPTVTELYVGYCDNRAEGTDTSPKIDGYSGFYTCFQFTLEGKFISMGAWE